MNSLFPGQTCKILMESYERIDCEMCCVGGTYLNPWNDHRYWHRVFVILEIEGVNMMYIIRMLCK